MKTSAHPLSILISLAVLVIQALFMTPGYCLDAASFAAAAAEQAGGNISDQAWILYEGGEVGEAYKLIEYAKRSAPSDPLVISRYEIISAEYNRRVNRFMREGDMYMASGELTRAMECYTFVLEIEPNNCAALAKMKRLNEMSLNYIDFFAMMDDKYGYETASRIDDVEAASIAIRVIPPPSARQHLFNARRLMSLGKWQEALDEALKVRGLMPGKEREIDELIQRLERNLQFSRELADADQAYRNGEFEKALKIYQLIESKRGVDATLGLRLGECLARAGKGEEAMQILDKYAGTLAPGIAYQKVMARILALRGSFSEAAWKLWRLSKAVKNDSELESLLWNYMFRAYWFHWLLLLLLIGASVYMRILARALIRDASLRPGLDILTILREMPRPDSPRKAERLSEGFRSALEKCSSTNFPCCHAMTLCLRGIIHLERGRFKEAANDFSLASKSAPFIPDFHFNGGVTAMSDHSREKDAPEYFQKAMQVVASAESSWAPARIMPLARPELKNRVPSARVSAMFILVRDLLRKGKVAKF